MTISPSLWSMADSAWKGACLLAAAIFVLALPIERWVQVFKGLSEGTVQGMATTINLIAEGTIVVVLVWMGLRAAYLKGVQYEINPDRIEWTRGLFSRKIDNIDMFRVIDIKLHRSILDCITGVGTITLMTKDESDPTFELRRSAGPERSTTPSSGPLSRRTAARAWYTLSNPLCRSGPEAVGVRVDGPPFLCYHISHRYKRIRIRLRAYSKKPWIQTAGRRSWRPVNGSE